MSVVKISELVTADELRQRDLNNADYRAEFDRTRIANDIAILVLKYRTEHRLSQSAFGRIVGMRQPHVARLEAADHEPSLDTLVRLSAALGTDFTLDINPSGATFRASA